jgi:hypothetical protein
MRLTLPWNKRVDFYEIRWRGNVMEGDFDAIIFHPVASTIPQWQVNAKLVEVNVGSRNFEC